MHAKATIVKCNQVKLEKSSEVAHEASPKVILIPTNRIVTDSLPVA